MEMTYDFSTHIVPLTLAISQVKGDVLELGTGSVSTPLLHGLCMFTKPQRKIVTLEENPSWLGMMQKDFECPWHSFRHALCMESVLEFLESAEWKFGVALIDQCFDGSSSPETGMTYGSRKRCAKVCARICDVIVIHDSDYWDFKDDEDWNSFVESFKYQWKFKLTGPETLVLSNVFDVKAVLVDSPQGVLS